MLGTANSVLRDTIAILQDPEKWNPDGSYKAGKKCIVTALFQAAVYDSDPIRPTDKANRAVRDVIETRFGLSRGRRWNRYRQRDEADIIRFNDHTLTTHEDVMWVLTQAEFKTRPWWREAPWSPPHE